MTVSEFRKHKSLPFQWKKELETNGILRVVMEVIKNDHPDRFAVQTDIHDEISPTKATLLLGHTRGYSAVINLFYKLAEPIQTKVDVGESTYAPIKEN